MEYIWLELHYGYFLFVFILSVLTCYVGLTFAEKLRMDAYSISKKLHLVVGSILLGVMFWLTDLMFALSVNVPISHSVLIHYSISYIVLASVGSYIVLSMVSFQNIKTRYYIIGGLLTSAAILITNLFGLNTLFPDYFAPKLMLLILTALITSGIAFASLRFMIQISRERTGTRLERWKYGGGFVIALALAFLPYITLTAVLDIRELNVSVSYLSYSYLMPFCGELFIVLLLWLIPDIFGEQKSVEQESKLKENQAEFESLFYNNPDGVFAIDRHGSIISVNRIVEKYVGLKSEHIINKPFLSFVTASDESHVLQQFNKTLEGEAQDFNFSFKDLKGNLFELRTTLIPIIVDGHITGVYGIAKDITEITLNQRKIHHLAYHDELTGLPNRRMFKNELEQEIDKASRMNGSFGVMFLDIDRFKKLNDLFGHAFGDQLIRELSFRLRGAVSESCTIARMSGDEFMIMLPEVTDKDKMGDMASQLLNSLAEPLTVRSQECYITASIGIAMYPEDGQEAEMLMKQADIAMFEAKQLGKNTYEFYRTELNERNYKHLMLENDLRKAIDRNELVLHYQPKFSTLTNEITGLEALVRWKHPKYGMVSPGDFIPLAEETGLIVPLEKWVLETACVQLKEWHVKGWTSLRVAVNLSARHFHNDSLTDDVLSTLLNTGLHPTLLELEITESMVMNDDKQTIEKLMKLKRMGIQISIDDFGTGYSSLSYLQKLPINRLKIDRSFVKDLTENSDSDAIVTMIISMAKHLQLEVVAEGVETEQQLQFLHEHECHDIQGYYFSRPLEADALEELLGKHTITEHVG